MERRAKIVCTLGPASSTPRVLGALVRGGMDVARINASHGTHDAHLKTIKTLREVSGKLKSRVALLLDLQGVKIRVGTFPGGAIELKPKTHIRLRGDRRAQPFDQDAISVSYPDIALHAKKGQRIFIDDGLIELKVLQSEGRFVVCKVVEGGWLKDRKGVNLPGMSIDIPSFTQKDREDLSFGLNVGVDIVAVSFVREAADIRKVKAFLKRQGADIPIIAKIEKPEAVTNIEGILEVSDGIMVARGDLGVEVSPEEVPMLQKRLIHGANERGKIVITATQMLESMTESPRPTRAEVADVANAVMDGTDALMLSGETSAGRHPVGALKMMDRVIRATEQDTHKGFFIKSPFIDTRHFPGAIAEAAVLAARDTEARTIVAFTQSGFTARLVSSCRPTTPIVAFTPFEHIARTMRLLWGVRSEILKPIDKTDALLQEVDRVMLQRKLLKKGDTYVITTSIPLLKSGTTNLLKLHRAGD